MSSPPPSSEDARPEPNEPGPSRAGSNPVGPDRTESGGIPEVAEGTPDLGGKQSEHDDGAPVGPTPPRDFWDAIYTRRSIRRFRDDPVPRDLVDQVMHAGIWAPSSCNYQMWDLVAVDDPQVNRQLAELSSQMGNAPVNIVVSYGRDFSEEGSANIQSASALIQNMSLAASVLGLGTFWITQMGDGERVREVVGLPYDRLVIAVLAVGFPKFEPKRGPKRRPLDQVSHWNHYAGKAIPSSADPEVWDPELLTIYQRARVLNGLRHNKPRAWEVRALVEMLDRFVPKSEATEPSPRWLDVLPCTGIVTERLARERGEYAFDIVERSPEVAQWVARRTRPAAGTFGWNGCAGMEAPADATYDVVSCFFRLEDLPSGERSELLRSMARWLKPEGALLLGYVNKRSFHDWTERARARRGGPKGVEYVLSPDPNIGPFESLDPRALEKLCAEAGLRVDDRLGLQAVPQPEEIEFRSRNFGPRGRKLAHGLGRALGSLEKLPGLQNARGRFRFLRLRKG